MSINKGNATRSLNNATTWVLSVWDSDLTPTQKLICCYLTTHMNDYRDCAWPSAGRIADKCNLSVRAVRRNLQEICNAGYLLHNGTSNLGTKIYVIYTPELDSPPAVDAPAADSPPCSRFTPPLQQVPSPPAPGAPELTKELTNNNQYTQNDENELSSLTVRLGGNASAPKVGKQATRDTSTRFADFWKAYPNKKSKMAAEKKWKKISPEDKALALADVSVRSIKDKDWIKDDGKYIPHPSTYLNSGGWLDEWAKKDSVPAWRKEQGYYE